MKSDFLLAITQLSAEKNLSKEVVLGAVEAALASAYRKNSFAPNQEISVKINPTSGRVEVWAEKTVVEQVSDSRSEVSLKEALKLNPDVQLEDAIYIEDTPHNAGRIAAQTAKQVILQRLHEAEHSAIYEEYTDKQGDIITGMVRRIESRQVFVDLGRSEAIMPQAEQAPNERYRIGQRLKVYLVEVSQTAKGPVLIVSRSHPNLLRRLFELEVPEIYNGTVEIKAVAREAGLRSKIAVAASQEGIDSVGCCVGLRGIRIQNIVNELNGEKIDVVAWSSDMSAFITNAISPAQVARVELHEEQAATVVIPDRQLSLAIGKEGQNVRLAVKLTGWRVDIKSASEYERERAEAAKDEAPADEELGAEVPGPSPVSAEVTPETAEALTEAVAAPGAEVKPIRFAEEVLTTAKAKPQTKDKKKKKKTARKESAVDGIRLKKKRRVAIPKDEDEETDYY